MVRESKESSWIQHSKMAPDSSKFCHEDIFCGVFQPSLSKYVSLAVGSVFVIVSFLLSASFIYYDRQASDHHRTVMHRMSSVLYWLGWIAVPVIEIQGLLRILVGPLGENVCLALNFYVLKIIKNMFLLLLNINILARSWKSRRISIYTLWNNVLYFNIISDRYVYCFRLRNPLIIDDNFWGCFLTIWAFVFSVIINISQVASSPRKSSFYFMCSGLDPTENSKLKNGFNEHLEVASLFIHVVIRLKIWKERKKINPDLEVNGLRTLTSDRLKDIDMKSLSSFVINIGWVIMVCLFLAAASKYQKLTLDEMNAYPNYIYVHLIYVLAPASIGFGWNVVIFIKHEDFRLKLYRTVKMNFFQRRNIKRWLRSKHQMFYFRLDLFLSTF